MLAPASIPIPQPPGQAVVAPGAGFFGFSGLTELDSALAGTGVYANSQGISEPPDQGLCVGNGYVMEVVNSALAVYSTRGKRLGGPTALSQFFHVAPEYGGTAKQTTFGPLLSDPRCHFDADTQRWFVTELEADVDYLTGAFRGPTAAYVAVSQSANPNGAYSLYAIDTTDAETAGCPCLGDQPLLGADANGIYVSTNEFTVFPFGAYYGGSQIYALSKRALAAGVLPTVVHINVGVIASPAGGAPSFSVQPAISPDSSQENTGRNGTEFFLSSRDITRHADNAVAVWALTNTKSLRDFIPNVTLQHVVIPSVAFSDTIPAVQKPGPTPLGTSLDAPLELIDTGGNRMNQVVYSAGRLWAGLNTAVRFGGATNTGIAYFVVAPQIASNGNLGARMTAGGYVAVKGENVIYPSIGVNARGVPLMAFTLVGPQYHPSAAFVTENGGVVGNVQLAAAGVAPDDGFTGYPSKPDTVGVARWGDYSAAVADRDGSIWFGTEYIPNAPRTQFANWGTFIGHVPTHN